MNTKTELAESSQSPLASARVLLEACPPAMNDKDKAYAFLRQSFSVYNSFHAVSIPDIQDAGEFNRTRSRVQSEEFAEMLSGLTEKPFSLYKVTAGCTPESFKDWLDETLTAAAAES